MGAFLSASWRSLLVAEGVKLVWKDRLLSADFLGADAFSSLVREEAGGGVLRFID
jgi:hypothetical protein